MAEICMTFADKFGFMGTKNISLQIEQLHNLKWDKKQTNSIGPIHSSKCFFIPFLIHKVFIIIITINLIHSTPKFKEKRHIKFFLTSSCLSCFLSYTVVPKYCLHVPNVASGITSIHEFLKAIQGLFQKTY